MPNAKKQSGSHGFACSPVAFAGSSTGTHLLLSEIAAAANVHQASAAVVVPLLAGGLTCPKDALELQAASEIMERSA